jgi:hypothetical protein
VTVNLIHEDLLLYKHVYEKISANFKESLTQNKQLETMIDSLRLENSKLVNLIKSLKNSGSRDQKQIISKLFFIYKKNFLAEFYENYERERVYEYSDYIRNNDFENLKPSGNTDKDTTYKSKQLNNLEEINEISDMEDDDEDSYNYNLYSPIADNFPEKIQCTNANEETRGIIPTLDLSKTKNANYKLEKKEEEKGKTSRITKKLLKQENEEWLVSLKYAGFNQEELLRFSKNKLLTKLFEVMLNLNRIIEEKNCLLQSAVNKLKQTQNEKLKKERENIELYQKIISLRKDVEEMFGKNKIRNINIPSLDKLKDRKESFTVKSSKDKDGKIDVNYEATECSMMNNVNNDNSIVNIKEGKDDLSGRISINDLRVDTENLEKLKGERFKFDDNYNENDNLSDKSNITEIR